MIEIKSNKLIFCHNCLSKMDNDNYITLKRTDNNKFIATFICEDCLNLFDITLDDLDVKIDFNTIKKQILENILECISESSTKRTELEFHFTNSLRQTNYEMYSWYCCDMIESHTFYLNFYNENHTNKIFSIDLKNILEEIGFDVNIKFYRELYNPDSLYDFCLKISWKEMIDNE